MAQVNNYEWIDSIPQGWAELARKMIEECEENNPTYTIEDLKEKWGKLRVYSFIQDYNDNDWLISGRQDEKIASIEDKYEAMSARTCCKCGKSATKYSTGWVLPWCDECGTDEERYYKRFE